MIIAIRTDANLKIATGHLMRCISIAVQIRKLGHEILFITADDFPSALLHQNGFSHVCLNSSFEYMNDEIDKLLQILKQKNICGMLVDSYYVTPEYFEAINAIVKTAYIDDVFMFDYNVNLVVNYNVYAKMHQYTAKKQLISPEYAPLRQEFECIAQKNINKFVTNIMITMGGTDENNISSAVAIALNEKLPAINIHIVAGGFFRHNLDCICNGNIIVHKNAKMSEIMQMCDVAISAGGTTIYELCACGVPTVLLSIASNQTEVCKAAEKHELMLYAGVYENSTKKIIYEVMRLVDDFEHRKRLSKKASSIVDGKGAAKIANELILCFGS